MSLLLALEASTPAIGVSLHDVESGACRCEIVRPGARGDVLPALVEEALQKIGAAPVDVTRIACGTGPGSFTGIRAALATAEGFALRRSLPLEGVDSLQAALAATDLETLQDRPRVAVLDAYRHEVFARRLEAGVSALTDRSGDLRLGHADLSGLFAGNPVILWYGRDNEGLPTEGTLDLLFHLRPSGIARLALAGSTVPPVPNYMREAAPVELRMAAAAKA